MVLEQGSKNNTVTQLQKALNRLGFSNGKADGHFGDKTEHAVIAFQESENLYADGIVGPVTFAALQDALHRLNLELYAPDQESTRLPLVRVDADPMGEGYNRFNLRADVADAYDHVRKTIVAAGAIITSSGAIRSLTTPVNPSRSATSLHYLGRAMDLYIWSGMQNPEKDPFIIVYEGERYFRVYARASKGKHKTLKAATKHHREGGDEVNAKVIDLTALFEEQGFTRIKARRSFFRGGTYLGAEWWHFQNMNGLFSGVTTYGSELLRLYSEHKLEGTPPWAHRDKVFDKGWA